jgi:hypothetical protein
VEDNSLPDRFVRERRMLLAVSALARVVMQPDRALAAAESDILG